MCFLTRLTDIVESLAGTFDFFQDVGWFGGPDERLWLVTMPVDVGTDGVDELFDIAKTPRRRVFALDLGRSVLSC